MRRLVTVWSRLVLLCMAAAGVLGTSAVVYAQLQANQVFVGQTFGIQADIADADRQVTASYKLSRNGTVVATRPVAALTPSGTAGVWNILFPGLTETAPGSITFEVRATGLNGIDSDPGTLVVEVLTQTPGAPSTIRLIRVP